MKRLGYFKRRIQKSLILAALLLSLGSNANAQSSVNGRVLLKDDGPVYGIVVGIKDNNKHVITNDEGAYSIGLPDTGTYTLVYIYSGYKVVEIKVKSTPGTVRLKDVILEQINEEVEEVVITGTLKETFLKESPVHVEVLTPKLFQKNPTPSLFDALQMVNGVRPQINCNVCNTGDIHINGMEGPYTMVLIDGMPIVSSLSTVYGLSGIPNSLVERIEIVKGPASTLYGSEAVAGLINIITKDPNNAPKFTLDIFSTSQWEKNFDFGTRFNGKKFTSLFSGNYFHFNNRLDVNNDNFTDVTLQHRVSLFNKTLFKLDKYRNLSLGLRYYYEDRFGGEMNWEKKFRGGDSVYGESIYTRRVEMIGQYPISKSVNFSWSFNNHLQNSAYGITSYLANQSVGFAQVTWNRRISFRHDILAGAGFRYTWYDDNTPATQSSDTFARNRPSKTPLPGIFVQDEYVINDKLKVLTGIRFDHHPLHGGILSPRINFKYDRNKWNTVRLGIGNGYRVVNLFTEEHAALTGSRNIIVKNELKPEQSWNATLNYTTQINHPGGFITADFAAFYTYFTNKIVGDFLTDPNSIIYDNLDGHAITRGVSFNTSFHFKFPLKITAGSTLMQVYRESAGVRVNQVHAPGYTGNFILTYSFKKPAITLDYSGNVTGPMLLPIQKDDFRPEHSPWHSIQNFQVSWKAKKQVTVYAGVKNLLNFLPKNPLMRPFDPFDKHVADNNPNGYTFDTTYNYAPLQGIRGFAGVRVSL